MLDGPFIYYAKPQYEFKNLTDPEYDGYVGDTRYIGTYYGSIVTVFGLIVALSRMRDKIVRAKITNMWYHATCRRRKMIKFDEFEKICE